MDHTGVINEIVVRVVEECRKSHVTVDEEFCAFYVKLTKMDPNWQLKDDFSYRKIDLLNFVRYVATRFLNTEDPKMKILKLQFWFETLTVHIQRFVEDRRKVLEEKLAPLEALVLEHNSDKLDVNRKGIALLNYVTLASGLGNPQSPKVFGEVKAVMMSVMDRKEFLDMLGSARDEKVEKLKELTSVIAGIRLYNRDCLKGGHEIQDLPVLLSDSVIAVRKVVSSCVKTRSIDVKIHKLSRALDRCYLADITKTKSVLDCSMPPYVSGENMEYGKLLLVVYHQFSISLCNILKEIDNVEEKIQATTNSYNRILNYIHSKVVPSSLMQASHIFPSFMELYEYWKEFQDEAVMLASLRVSFQEQLNLVHSLPFYSKLVMYITDEGLDVKSPSLIKKECLESLELSAALHKQGKQISVHSKEFFEQKNSELKLEYSGFCCWKLVSTEGVLSMGNADYGIVTYNRKHYVFSCSKGLRSFIRDPEYYVARVFHLARINQELIILLCLRDDMNRYKTVKKIVGDEIREVRIKYTNAGEPVLLDYREKGYEPNIWNIKRNAMQLANLKRRKTSSTQTVKSSFFASVGVQSGVCKDQGVQTNCEISSNTPKPSRYVVSLRGRRNSIPFCLDLTNYKHRNLEEKSMSFYGKK